jgi:hypothetical protein
MGVSDDEAQLSEVDGTDTYVAVTEVEDQPTQATTEQGDQMAATGQDADSQAGMMVEEGTLNLAEVVANPNEYLGRTITTTAEVQDIPTDRGLWLDAGDGRIFVVLSEKVDNPKLEETLNAGERVRVTATITDAKQASKLQDVKPVEQQTNTILAQENVFLHASELTQLGSDQASQSDQGADNQMAAAGNQQAAGTNEITLQDLENSPEQYIGQTVTVTAEAVELETDRAFYLGSSERVFTVLANRLDTPDWKTDVNESNEVRITASVLDGQPPQQIEELAPMWDEAKQILAERPILLRVTEISFPQR